MAVPTTAPHHGTSGYRKCKRIRDANHQIVPTEKVGQDIASDKGLDFDPAASPT
jgi:hypothetical protein